MTLYGNLISQARLLEGWTRVEQNSPMAGADGVSVRMFALRLDEELAALQRALCTRTYEAGLLFQFDIPKPQGGHRTLAVPPVRDRVVQAAALAVLQPILEATFEEISYAYRPGRSYQDAIAHLRLLRDEGYHWVVDADIVTFFDVVDHEQLFKRFAEVVPDPDVQRLIEQWVGQTPSTIRNASRVPKGYPKEQRSHPS